MVLEFQCLGSFVFRGEGGSGKNDHDFRFLGNIELYERPLSFLFEQGRVHLLAESIIRLGIF